MLRTKKWNLNFLPFLIILALVGTSCNKKKASHKIDPAHSQPAPATERQTAKSDNPGPNKKPQKVLAPDFTLKEINGKSLTLSDLRGKVVVLNIWATWCPPCRREIPDFIDLQNELGGEGLQIIGVSVDQQGTAIVKPFVKQHGMNYPVMVDNGIVEREYGPIKYVPTTFVIDRDGYIQGYAPGMLTKEILKPILIKLLNKKTDI